MSDRAFPSDGGGEMISSGRILVIDDEKVICDSCRKVLEQEGYEVSTTIDGGEGLDRAWREEFDAVIVDIRMPRTSGFDVLHGIKEQKPETAVVMITAYPSVGAAAQSVKGGAADYLVKPFTPDELRLKVRKAIRAGEGRMPRSSWIGEPASTVRERAEVSPPSQILIVGAWEHADVLQEIARSERCSVEMAYSAQEVLERVRKGEVEVLILGLDVFRQQAHDLIPAVRRIGGDIPIIVVSSDPFQESGQKAPRVGILFYLVEPFGAEEVKAVIRGAAKRAPFFKKAIPGS